MEVNTTLLQDLDLAVPPLPEVEEEQAVTVTLVDRCTVVPEATTRRRRLFLSNIDLTLVSFLETVSFFDPPPSHVTLGDMARSLRSALSRLLVAYDFVAGRLEKAEEGNRLEIHCNGAGVVVATATCSAELSSLGQLRIPKPAYKELVRFLQDNGEGELREKPLMLYQLTQFKCGSVALASRANHCIMDGVAGKQYQDNLAAFTRGLDLIVAPNTDRSVFRAQDPPNIKYTHFEYSELTACTSAFSARGLCTPTLKQPPAEETRLIYMSSKRIARLKTVLLNEQKITNSTTFHLVTAKIWKARSIAAGLPDEATSTVLFPVDVRRRVVPSAPDGFAGNALVPGFARATVRELKAASMTSLVSKVREGIKLLSNDYVRSGIDWLEVHRGVPCQVNSFSVVAWWKLGLEEAVYSWGKIQCLSPVELHPGLVILLPGDGDEEGINICIKLPSHQMKLFCKLMSED